MFAKQLDGPENAYNLESIMSENQIPPASGSQMENHHILLSYS